MDEFTWLPDWNAQATTASNVTKVQFADGYAQRQSLGMNPLDITWGLTFNPRSDADAEAIEDFLAARFGVTAFTWTPPGKSQAKWTCDTWSRTKASVDNNNLSMTFTLVYEP